MMLATAPRAEVPSVDRARLTVTCGPLARALAGRFVAALCAAGELPVDRLEEAVLVTEALADRCTTWQPDGELALAVAVRPGRLEIRVGPLEEGDASELLRDDAAHGGAIRGLADAVEIRSTRNGEFLRVAIDARYRRGT